MTSNYLLRDVLSEWALQHVIGIGDDGRRHGIVRQALFHPHHIVPCAELIAAAVKGARNGIAEPRVEVDAGAAQVRVVSPGGGGDAGVQHLHMLCAGGVLQRMIQPGAQTTARQSCRR